MKLTVLAITAAVFGFGELAWQQTRASTPSASQGPVKAAPTVLCGKARFQVLTPAPVRLEYSPSGEFTDAASVVVINREDWPHTPFGRHEADGWVMISTELLNICYQNGSGPFTHDNLRIVWRDGRGEHQWKPGDTDEQNLGGVPASLDNRSTKAVTEPGPLSRSGCYRLDDSKTALFDPSTGWVKPRPTKDGQDWYFLAYGSDYKSVLGRLARLVGPVPMLPRYVFGAWFGSPRSLTTGTRKRD